MTETFAQEYKARPAISHGLAFRLMVLTRISWSHGEAQNLMVGRSYYAPK